MVAQDFAWVESCLMYGDVAVSAYGNRTRQLNKLRIASGVMQSAINDIVSGMSKNPTIRTTKKSSPD